MKKVKGMPITGSSTQMQPQPGVLANQAETSSDLQKRVKRAPQPFTNTGGGATTPASSGASGNVSTLEPKIQSGLKHSNPGAKALPNLGAVGQNKPINQSKQIGGHMGWPPPARKAGVNGQGYPVKKKRNPFFGEYGNG